MYTHSALIPNVNGKPLYKLSGYKKVQHYFCYFPFDVLASAIDWLRDHLSKPIFVAIFAKYLKVEIVNFTD